MSEKQDALAIAPPQILPKDSQANKLTRLAVFTPTNMTEAMGLAKLLSNSDFVPKDFKGKPGNCFLAMQMGAEVGLAPVQAIQNIAVINGRPGLWGDAMLAIVQSHPDYEDHKEFFTGAPFEDNYTAVFQIKRKGQSWHEVKFSVGDAKTAKLWQKRGYNGGDTPWITSPKRMLQMRSRGFGLRDKFADALKGLRLAEEIMDIPPEKPQRDGGTLDIKNEMATLTVSTEPNRGHGNEGMSNAPALSQPSGMDQTAKKQDATICADCQELNGKHKPDCFYATSQTGKCQECNAQGGHLPKCSKHAEWKESLDKKAPAAPQAAQGSVATPKAASTPSEVPAGLQRIACKVLGIQHRNKKPLRMVTVQDNNGEWQMSCWHESFYEYIDGAKDSLAIFDISVKTKDGRDYTNLEHIVELGGIPFVNDKPAEQSDFPLDNEPES